MSTFGSHFLNFVLYHYRCRHPVKKNALRMSTSRSHFLNFFCIITDADIRLRKLHCWCWYSIHKISPPMSTTDSKNCIVEVDIWFTFFEFYFVSLRMSTSGSLNFTAYVNIWFRKLHCGCQHPVQKIALRMSTSGS